MALRLSLTEEEFDEIETRDRIALSRLYWREVAPPKVRQVLTRSPGFQPTAIQARQVSGLTALGMSPKEIATALLIDKTLLLFYYKRELESGTALVNAKVGHVALKMALSGDSPTMTQFWLSRRASWKETTVTEATVEIRDVSEARRKLLGDKSVLEGVYETVPEMQICRGTAA